MLTRTELRALAIHDKMERPPVQWDEMNAEFDAQYRDELIKDLESIVSRAAMLSGYLERRSGSGCGDQGHEAAVKEANRRLKAVRKALGFTYPQSGCFNF